MDTQLAMILAVPPGAQAPAGTWKWLLGVAIVCAVLFIGVPLMTQRTSMRKPLAQQENELREVLRNTKPDSGGYIHVDPNRYIRINKKRAEEIAKEEGFYNQGLGVSTDWHFHKQVS